MSKPLPFSFTLNANLVLGTPSEFRVRDWTMRDFSPSSILSNTPWDTFVVLESASIDGTTPPPFYHPERGHLTVDASAFAIIKHPDGSLERDGKKFPPMRCRHGVEMTGRYTGQVPRELAHLEKFLFCLSFHGEGSD